MRLHASLLLASLAVLPSACSDGTGPEDGTGVSLRTVGAVQGQELVVTGTNGTLRLTDIRLIVDELELEPADGEACAGPCAEFEARGFLATVPVDGTPLNVARADIPDGRYDELEFEVDDLADDDDGPAELQDLRNTVRALFPDWPAEASMVVIGTFHPIGGAAIPFRAYFDADIEVELEFSPPLRVEGEARSIVVELLVDRWFKRADGTVRDLSRDDFPSTGRVVDFRAEIEGAFDLRVGG